MSRQLLIIFVIFSFFVPGRGIHEAYGWIKEHHIPVADPDGIVWIDNTSDGIAIRGESEEGTALEAITTGGMGMWGTHEDTGNYGIIANSIYGVSGYSSEGHGVSGRTSSGYGVYGANGYFDPNRGYLGSPDYGVYGENSNDNFGYLGGDMHGVYGEDEETYGFLGGHIMLGGIHYGVLGSHDPTNNWGVLGAEDGGVCGYSDLNYAGRFVGDVSIQGSLSKGSGSFVIDHPLDPENKLLRHNFVESPEHLLIYSGRTELDGTGEAVVEMPDYFIALTEESDASIQLTPVGRPFPAGADWNDGFESFTAYGKADREVFWQVSAYRDDPVIRQLGRPVEEEKGPDNKLCDRGEFLYPEAYGYPETMGRNYTQVP